MSDAMQQPKWDVFISHASEDKETVARPLAEALARHGIKVWFDAEQLTLGDSLRRSIDQGLAQSRYGIVILSRRFFAKEWPMKELDGLVAREDGKDKVILPIWHEVSEAEVKSFSPMLADKLAVSTSEGLENVVEKVLRAIFPRGSLEPELIPIPASEFLMGTDPAKDKDALKNEQPQHTLQLPEYYIAKTPVTNAQYAIFMEATGRGERQAGKTDHPVVNVTWQDAVDYCQWLAEVTGKAYRLPSEAEWERAARGTDGRIFPWGDDPPDETRCNFDDSVEDTTPVGQYSRQGDSPFGCVDMAGNVLEWTLSLHKKYPYDPEDGREDPQASDALVLRGGAFCDSQGSVRCAYRYTLGDDPSGRGNNIGFRLVVAPGSTSDL